MYVGLTSTNLSRRLTMDLSDTSSNAHYLKNMHARSQYFGKLSIKHYNMQTKNTKQIIKTFDELDIRNIQPTLYRINFESSANVLKCLLQLALFRETSLKQ